MIEPFTKWIAANPAIFMSLVTAILAASVALIVMLSTHFLTQKRERTLFRTNKLESLYLLLNQVSENNTRHFKLVKFALMGDQASINQLHSIDELDLYGHRQAKQIIMLIRLYFPKLSSIHQALFSAQSDQNKLIFQLYTKTPPELNQVIEATGRISRLLRLMEEEMVRNQSYLLQDYSCLMHYKKTARKKIQADLELPEGPITSENDHQPESSNNGNTSVGTRS